MIKEIQIIDGDQKDNFPLWEVHIKKIDNQLPVIFLAIRQRSLDLKHLIPGNGPPKIQGKHTSAINNAPN